MANNMIRRPGEQRAATVSHPSSANSGDPVRVGLLTGVALTDVDGAGVATVDFGPATWLLPVAAVDASGDAAIVAGDALYYNDGDSPPLNKRVGLFFGVADEGVAAGETAVIEVTHVPGGGAAALGVSAPGWLATGGGLVIDIDTDTESGAAIDRLTGLPATLPAGSFVERADVVTTEQFGAQLTSFALGKSGTANWLIDDAEHGLRDAAPNVARIVNNPVALVATPLLIAISQAGNATGAATIFVRYSIL